MIVSDGQVMFVCLMVFNATFNTISVISWRSVLLKGTVAEDPEKTTDLSQVTDKFLSLNVLHLALIEVRTRNISGGSRRKTNYHIRSRPGRSLVLDCYFFLLLSLSDRMEVAKHYG